MELRQLRYFVSVAQLKSFSMASRSLGVAQPALSRQMQQLERELGTLLLDRHARGISITPAGELFFRRAQQILADVELTRQEIGVQSAQLSGQHTLGMPIPVTALLLERLYRECPRKFPGVSLRLIEGFSALLPDWLVGGSIDLAILYAADHPAINATPLLTEPLYLVGAKTSELHAMSTCELADIADLPLIMPHRPHPLWDALDQHGIFPRRVINAAAIGIMKRLASEGPGYALLPLSTFHREIASGEFVALPVSAPTLTRDVSLCHSKFRPASASLRAILGLIEQEVRDLVTAGAWPGARLIH